MANMMDYLQWRGDILFRQVSVNAVDSLIFSTLVYIDFSEIVPWDLKQSISLSDAASKLLSLPHPEDRCRVKADLLLLKAAAQSPRFRDIRLTGYKSELLQEEESQFAAIAFLLDDGSAFLAFRGTDDTLVGWKENFNMSFQDIVPAQRSASAYTESFADIFTGAIRLGGHSKGGNLAVFSAATVSPDTQGRIWAVFNHDGPGFSDYLMEHPGYATMVPKIHTYIPQSSVVGMLLEHKESYSVIYSKSMGILQHEPYRWEVMGRDFIHMEEITQGAKIADNTVRGWVAGMTREERCELVESLYAALSESGADTVEDLMQPKYISSILKHIQSDKKTKNILTKEILQFFRAAGSAMTDLQS